jgi:xylan 1,4-beta-xylosidase
MAAGRLATRRDDGSVVIALWNYAPPVGHTASYTPGQPAGTPKHFSIDVRHLTGGAHATMWRLDESHGNAIAEFDRMGRPDFPSREQLVQLREAGKLTAPESLSVSDGRFEITVPVQGLVVVELR